ncbi:MAG: molybdopterin molybdotransferase MoeA [Endozoicomonas sp.]
MSDSCAIDGLMRLEEVLDILIHSVPPVTEVESVSLEESLGRILAKEIISPINVPSHDNSVMDGYALRLSDLQTTDCLPLAGQSLAGHPFSGKVPSGSCIRIMTGASIPQGADTVIMQEQTEMADEQIRFLNKPDRTGNNIRYAGEDIPCGSRVFIPTRRVRPQDIGLLATLGISTVNVYRKVKVAVFSTGDELRLPGEALGQGDIYDSNRFVIKAMLQRMNADILDLGKIADDKEALRKAFFNADEQADAVISSGGVSVGDTDYIKEILDEQGETKCWKLAIKPGKPFTFGQLPNSVFFGLPGNPVSATVTFQQLTAPALRHMMNQAAVNNVELTLATQSSLKKKPGRRDFQRGKLVKDQAGKLQVISSGNQGSGVMSTLNQSDCYIVLPEEAGNIDAGSFITVQLFDELLS